ncbi:MAG TPA: beta-propeller fold lactonase family protein, partial [Thermoguttaceae bacterium]|nr:beta-propeller fold lactonase family protein [Thermoguttaceae bacterium]
DETGTYRFANLTPGTYTVVQLVPDTYKQTSPPDLPGTGRLTFSQMLQSGQDGVTGISDVQSIAISPDGSHVYTASRGDDSVAVFERDARTGDLTFVHALADGQDGVEGLDGAYAVVVSPDGRNVYSTAIDGDAVDVFRRDAASGQLTLVQALKDGQDDIEWLDGANAVAVSPDGQHVYVTADGDSALTVFRRDAITGALSLIGALQDGQDGVDGLFGPNCVVVSPDGDHVYVSAFYDESVAVFRRDASSGQLAFLQIRKEPRNDQIIRGGPLLAAGSLDGEFLYAIYATSYRKVAMFRRDRTSGQLTYEQKIRAAPLGGWSMALAPDGNQLYVTAQSNLLSVLSRDPASGEFSEIQRFRHTDSGMQGLYGVRPIIVSPDGRHVYAASHSDGDDWLVSFRRDHRANFHRLTLVPDQIATGVNFGNQLRHGEIRGVVWNDQNANGTEDPGEAALRYCRVYLDLNGNGQPDPGEPSSLTTASGTYAFTDLAHGTYTVAVMPEVQGQPTAPTEGTRSVNLLPGQTVWDADFGYHAELGRIRGVTWRDTNANRVRDLGEPGEAGVTVYLDLNANGQPDPGEPTTVSWQDDQTTPEVDETGTYQFTNVAPGTYTVAEVVPPMHDRTYPAGVPWTDELTFVRTVPTSSPPHGSAVSPDGRYVYVADGGLALYRRDADNGELTFVRQYVNGEDGVAGLAGASIVVVSPDGKNVYVYGSENYTLAVFNRDPATGQLSFLQVFEDNHGGVDGLHRATSVAVSPDSSNVYVSSWVDNAIAVFHRDPASGELAFVQVLKDGENGVDGLWFASRVVVSPDGRHVYASGNADWAIAVFRRDPVGGELTFVYAIRDGDAGADGLIMISSVTISPDGRHVYAANDYENAVSIFRRDATTGRLTFVEVLRDGEDGVEGLEDVYTVIVSPDGNQVYARGGYTNALAVFRRDVNSGGLTL